MKGLFRSVAFCLALSLPLVGYVAADTSDAWITTKAKITLLTTDGVSATDVNVDTNNGNVTLHGKVKTQAAKQKAESAVRRLDGVKSVNNVLQVVPEAFEKSIKASDDAIRKSVEDNLKVDEALKHVKVASVTKGVVVLSGKTETLDQKLRAIEQTWKVSGVERVASEIQAGEK
jgi:hyperosmotically inducible periplasmic protein